MFVCLFVNFALIDMLLMHLIIKLHICARKKTWEMVTESMCEEWENMAEEFKLQNAHLFSELFN